MRLPSLALPCAALLLVVASGCADHDAPPAAEVTPVPLDLAAPTYALASTKGLVLRSGDTVRTFAEYGAAEWLPGGRALLKEGWRVRGLWDPRSGEVAAVRLADPNRSVTRLALVEPERGGRPYRLVVHDLDGAEQWRVDLPTTESEDPDVERLYKTAHTIDGTTFLSWYDNSEDESENAYGVLRVADGGEEMEQVQAGTPIIAMWLAADGSALLATRRASGDPCGGCEVPQELIEIDPDTGATTGEWSMPAEYAETWDVAEVDKVGDRVAIRFEDTVFGEPDRSGDWEQRVEQRGTWFAGDEGGGGDGVWTMVPGSDRELSWWQGPDDRIVAVPLASDDDFNGGDEFAYFWEHRGERTRLRGLTHATRNRHYYEASVPGQLLPPS